MKQVDNVVIIPFKREKLGFDIAPKSKTSSAIKIEFTGKLVLKEKQEGELFEKMEMHQAFLEDQQTMYTNGLVFLDYFINPVMFKNRRMNSIEHVYTQDLLVNRCVLKPNETFIEKIIKKLLTRSW